MIKRNDLDRNRMFELTSKTCDSAIKQHLLETPDCAKNYDRDMFRIIGRARSSFHLAVWESIYRNTKKLMVTFFNRLKAALTGQPQQSCARVSDWPFSIHNWVYIFPRVDGFHISINEDVSMCNHFLSHSRIRGP